MKGCGNSECSVSTFIDDITLTFGSGHLDDNGLWKTPCVLCSSLWKKEHPKDSVWPEPEKQTIKGNK